MKLAQDVVLYMPAEIIGTEEPLGSVCGKCMMYMAESSECTILAPPQVDGARGVCGLYIHGPNADGGHEAMLLVPAEVAGYIEEAPTRCGNCRHFLKPHRCQVVRGRVEANGCCNAWAGRE